MRRAFWSTLAIGLLTAILAAGCASPAASTSTPAQAAPSAATVQPPGTVSASVSVEPVQISNMAFLVAAPIKEIDVRAGDQVKAGQTLVVLDTPELQYAVTGAQAELHSAQTNSLLESSTRQYRAWNGRKWIWVNGLPEVRAQADARVQQAQAALELAQAQLAQATLVAPFDGTVVSVDVTVGEMAGPN